VVNSVFLKKMLEFSCNIIRWKTAMPPFLLIDFGTQPVYCQHGQNLSNDLFALITPKIRKRNEF